MLSNIKDKIIQTAAKKFLEGKVSRYGKLQSLHVQTKEKRMVMEFLPTGEAESIIVSLDGYRIQQQPEGYELTLGELTSNKPWLTSLLEDYANGMVIPLPPKVGPIVKNLL
jgi:hypothetical protein